MSQINDKKVRAAEIRAKLADIKLNYFANGISVPMSERCELEAELELIHLDLARAKDASKAKEARIRELANIYLRNRLAELGLSELMPTCRLEAEKQINAAEVA